MTKPFYVVETDAKEEDSPDLTEWLVENVKEDFRLVTSKDSYGLSVAEYEADIERSFGLLWLFSSLDDALLFKLTWGGSDAK